MYRRIYSRLFTKSYLHTLPLVNIPFNYPERNMDSKLKLRVLSDLHLEFYNENKLPQFFKKITCKDREEVLVLAGDIGNPCSGNNHYEKFISYVSKEFPFVFLIAGNHEYYNNKNCIMNDVNDKIKSICSKYSNVVFLNNSTYEYKDKIFIGTTLWTKVHRPSVFINDIFKIPDMSVTTYNIENRICRDFIKTTLENLKESTKKAIIITHHLPSSQLIDEKYKTGDMSRYNCWFYCSMEDIISSHNDKISCWIYGHTHTASITTLYDVPMICNPKGYPNENTQGSTFDFDTTITL